MLSLQTSCDQPSSATSTRLCHPASEHDCCVHICPEELIFWGLIHRSDIHSQSSCSFYTKSHHSVFFCLQKQLTALGLTSAWDQKEADFSGVSDKSKGKLHLGGVLHWASLELAAQAGKGGSGLEEEILEKPKLFYADHPFIVFVRDNASGALLLVGAVDHVEGEALHDEL